MYHIGIDLGGTNIAVGIVDENGVLLYKKSIPTDKNKDGEGLTRDMAEFSLKCLKEEGIEEKDTKSIGIGCPGVCNNEKGILVYTVNLPFRDTPVGAIFKEYTDIPVKLANDANCAAYGEIVAGGAKGYKNSITLTLGTGVGGGIIIDGKIYTGFNNAAGEMGHMVIKSGGEKCSCGRKGCLEAYASATALIRDTIRMAKKNKDSYINELCGGDYSKINAKTAFDAKRAGDKTGIKLVGQYIKYLGEGIIDYINIFQPEVILLGGGVSKEGEYLLEPLRKYVFKYTYGNTFLKKTRIEKAILGNDAGIIGAALMI